jgi:glyoxylase-like metal-dependent hydrolase (beta-lactamase superfamily II)
MLSKGGDIMKRRTALVALAVLVAATVAPAIAQQRAPSGPMVRAGTTQKLSEHVYVIPDNSTPGVPNVGFVVGGSAILVIDTGMGAPNGQIVLAEARKLGADKKVYLVTTHVHPEHDLGAQAFPADTTMIRSRAQVAEIAEEGMRVADVFRSRSEANRKLLEGAEFRPANLTFDASHDLDLGGVKVKLVALGTAHTQGDTGAYVEGDGVLFSGDVAMKALPAVSAKSTSKQWLASLDKLDGFKPKIVVPSHGPIGDAAYISSYRTYLIRVRDRAAALKKEGKTVDQAVETITAELKADYPDTGRAAGAIRAAYAEAS